MSIRDITNRYVDYDHSIGVFEIDLHDLWYLVIETAKITPTNEASTDRLINQIVYARELGDLSRVVVTGERKSDSQPEEQQDLCIESATTSTSGRMWTDLHFLATDMRDVWANSIRKMSPIERENLAGFTARLTALGVCDP